jgi:hypothetical protein
MKLLPTVALFVGLMMCLSIIYNQGVQDGTNRDPRNSNNLTTMCRNEYQRGALEQECKASVEIFAICKNKTDEVFKCKTYNCTLTNQQRQKC